VTMSAAPDAGPGPRALVAATENRYPVQDAGQAAMIGAVALDAVTPGGLEETTYPVTGLPPACTPPNWTLTVAGALPAAAVTPEGAPGTVGIMGAAMANVWDDWRSPALATIVQSDAARATTSPVVRSTEQVPGVALP
jgi:hypothetical protein